MSQFAALTNEKSTNIMPLLFLIMGNAQERKRSFLPTFLPGIFQRTGHRPREATAPQEGATTTTELPHAMQLNQLKMQIDMGAHFAITRENYPAFPGLMIDIANYCARTNEISTLEGILNNSYDPKLMEKLQFQIFKLRKERDEMMETNLPPTTEEFQKDGKQNHWPLTDQQWSTIHTVINAGLIDELKRLPFFEKLASESQRALTIHATLVALRRETESEEQFKGKGETGFRGDEGLPTGAEQRIKELQQQGRELMGGTSGNDLKEV